MILPDFRLALMLALALVLGCSSDDDDGPGTDRDGGGEGEEDASVPEDCVDEDGDGRGVGTTCLADDCDDGDPDVWEEADCTEQCAPGSHETGCACDAVVDQPEPCYEGPAGTEYVGLCVPGLRRCTDDGWTACDDQVLPGEETCNEADDDCDGVTDEDVQNECGTCVPCELDCLGEGDGCAAFAIDTEGAHVVPCEGDDGCITLGEGTTGAPVLWIASAVAGTVSKIDTRTRTEIARYRTGPLGESNGYLSGPGDGPSRTSVDSTGDVCIANRAFSGLSSVTRIAMSDCPDVDGDGQVETSSGPDDVLAWGTDECVLWNTTVGGNTAVARALAVQDHVGLDGVVEERAWVGLFNEHRYLEIDRSDGSLTGREADCSGCTPYGAAIDRDGNLWSACLTRNICRFDTEETADVEVVATTVTSYGITVDEEGLVWFAAGGDGDTLISYDPTTEEFHSVPGVNGAGVAADGLGGIWTGQCNTIYGFGDGALCRVDKATDEFVQLDAHSRGVAVDFDGLVWGVSMSGYLDVIDPGDALGDETVERAFEDCGAGGDEPCLPQPYTYSDMTGFQLQNATDPIGSYEHIFEGCDGQDATTWTAFTFDAEAPAGTRISFQVRTAADLPSLLAAPWIEAGDSVDHVSPVALEPLLGVGPHGDFLEIRAVLVSEDRVERPRLRGLGVQRSCDAPLG